MPTFPFIRRFAHAKVNLALSVGPPLPPSAPKAGYHPIASWMACIDLADELTLAALPESRPSSYEFTLASDAPRPSPIDWPVEKDLAVRAHRLLEQTVGKRLPVALTLIKRVPVGGGLGGGSSDAAAMLLAVRDLYRLDLTNHQLATLAAQLGSDIAFFLDDNCTQPSSGNVEHRPPAPPALVTGLGDQLQRVPRINLPILLLIPPFGCPTGPVYKAYDRNPVALRSRLIEELIALATAPSGPQLDPRQLFNDLAGPAGLVEPRLQVYLDRIPALARLSVHLTGSGSTMFTLPRDTSAPDELAHAADSIRSAFPELVQLMTRLV